MTSRERLAQAQQHLSRVDPVMRRVIGGCGPCRLHETWRRQALPALFQTIISQQISTAAASAIHRRFVAIYGGRAPSARAVLDTHDARLRAAGLSRPKIRALRDLAKRVNGRQLHLSSLDRLKDEEIVDALTQVIGIGQWTAQVFMIFRLGRLDVLPVGDLGLIDAARLLYGLEERPSAEKLRELAEPWRPYRSVASWYLWQGRRAAFGDRT